jgi:pimeloyl-ACP methyl ester carboxylesterase
MDSAGPPIVLVPGACLGGWAWQRVAQLLRERGHAVYPLTLTGLGERAHLADPAVDLDIHVDDVVNVLDYEALHDAIVVGHSYAGAVVTAVGDRRPERVNAIVYLDSGPLPDGAAIVDVQPPELRARQRREAESGGDGWRWPVPDRQTLESGVFGSTSGLEEEHFRWIAERGTPHPYATFTSPLRLTGGTVQRVRRAAIFCSAGGMNVETLRDLITAGEERGATFADPDWELHELSTGHWPMFSLPGPLAELLHELAHGS